MRNRIAVLCLLGWVWVSGALAADKKTSPAAADAAKDKETGKDKDKQPEKEKPFADVVKDAKTISGLFTVYRTDDNVYLEIGPEQFDRTYYLALTLSSGLGERGFYASQMGGVAPIAFHREGKTVQLVRRNTRFTARVGTPIERAVARSFSDSIVGTASLAAQPHPDRKSLLVDLGSLLLTDLPMLAYDLETIFRIPYRFESKGSAFGAIAGFPKNVEIDTVARYATERPPVPPLPMPGPPPTPPPPRNLADVRSMQLRLHYSLAEPPPPGYRPRLADDRVGHFFEDQEDFSQDVTHAPTRRFIDRWRLEKQDPSAALSPPKQPIVFWLENTIPEKYRAAVRDGALVWNRAFERIGFKDAIQVKQQPDDADWDPGDVRYSTIRWFVTTDAVFAIGPSNADPLTGEIYDADIGFAESMTRFIRREINEEVKPLGSAGEPRPPLFSGWGARPGAACDLAEGLVAQAAFGYDLLLVRGMEPEGPEADEFVRQFLASITAHEVGHTLGLRHNFHASTIHPLQALQDRALTGREGITGSVMDYIPVNLALDRKAQGDYFQTALGPYDYWAIEYAYKPIAAASPEDELPELRKIAARSSEPLLAYGTDEDAGFSRDPWDMDPLVNRWDLGDDPLSFYRQRLQLSREVWSNLEARLEKPGEGYQVLRRSFDGALGQAGLALALTAKYIGGVEHPRDHVGDPNGRLPFQPVGRARQQQALDLLRENLFSPRAFSFSPRLLNKLSPERFPDWRDFPSMMRRKDYPVHARVLDLQRFVLARLYHPVVLERILDSEVKDADPFRISALFDGLQSAIWRTSGLPAARSTSTATVAAYSAST